MRFQRTDAEPLFETRKLDKACLIVYASTGITASTTTVVGDVRARRESDRAWYDALESRYVEMFNKADKGVSFYTCHSMLLFCFGFFLPIPKKCI